jgi:hypothetical protein
VAATLPANARRTLVIGSDQVATFDGQQIGKPGTHERALAQLQAMRGREVRFHSALCLFDSASAEAQSVDVITHVRFRRLPDAALDAYLRAFDARSGAEVWQGRLPVPGVANPMTYLWKGEQYVVIAAGGHSEAGTSIGDSVVAFRLARAGEAPSLWSRSIDRPGGRFAAGAIAATLLLVLLAIALWRWRRAAAV